MPPSIQNKLNSHFLRRFDAVNHLECPLEFLGSSKLFDPAVARAADSNQVGSNSSRPAWSKTVISVRDSTGKSKSIILDSPLLQSLKAQIKAKFRVVPRQISLREGATTISSDEDIRTYLSTAGVEITFK